MKKLTLFLLAGILVLGCHHSSNEEAPELDDHEEHSDHETDSEHEDHCAGTLSFTIISGEYELFVEFPPLVAGEESEFNAHFTYLPNYKPVVAAQVSVCISRSGNELKATVDSPSSPGIFRPALKPMESGIHSMVFELSTTQGSTLFAIEEVEVFSDDEMAEEHVMEDEENGTSISFLKEQAWKTDFGVVICEGKNFREVISTSGQILPANGDENILVASSAGIVKLGSSVLVGKEVRKGETMVSLSGKGMAADNISTRYNEIKTNYEKARANYNRLEKLIDEKIISERDFLDAKTEYEQTRVAYENASQFGDGELNLIKSDLDGYIKDVKVTNGQFVQAGTPLAVIAKNKDLILRADVSQNHWHCLSDIREANFVTPYDSKTYNTNELNGRLVSYSRNAMNSSWSAPVFFEISNKGNLIPGSFIEVYLLSKPKPNVIAVPLSALIEEQGNFYVFVQLSGESYEKRKVQTGIENGREVEIVSGLNEGEIIVIRGAYQVKLASMTSSLPAHNHAH